MDIVCIGDKNVCDFGKNALGLLMGWGTMASLKGAFGHINVYAGGI